MKMNPIIFLSFFSLLFVVSPVFADSSVNITNNVNSSSSTTSNQNCHTVIHTETNGQVQDYDSNDCGDVQINTQQGSTTVENNSVPATSFTPEPRINPSFTPMPHRFITRMPTFTPMPTIDQNKIKQDVAKVKQNNEKQMRKIQDQQKNIFQKMQDFFKNLFSF